MGIAECPLGQVFKQLAGTAAGPGGVCSHTGRFTGLVSRSPCRSMTEVGGLGASTTELVSSIRNCPASMARKVVLPSAVGAMERTKRFQSYGPHPVGPARSKLELTWHVLRDSL